MTPHPLSLRGRSKSDSHGNLSCLEGRGLVCLFAFSITVDRHARKGLAMTKLELGNDQRLIPLLPPSIFTLEVSSLGSFGPVGLPPCLGQDSPRSPALLAFLESFITLNTIPERESERRRGKTSRTSPHLRRFGNCHTIARRQTIYSAFERKLG